MNKYKLRSYSLLGISLVILLISFIYLYHIRTEYNDLQNRVLHDETIMTVIYEANTGLLQAQAATHGHIMSQNEWFLNNYTFADSSFHDELNYLYELTRESPPQRSLVEKMDSVGRLKTDHLKEMFRIFREEGKPAAEQVIARGAGRFFMQNYIEFSNQLSDLTMEEIDSNKAELNRLYFLDLELTVAMGFVASVLLISLFIYFYRSQQKMSEYNIMLEERNEELQQFSYVASHDLKEPLRMVKSFLTLLENKYRGQLDEKADEYIHYAVDGAERMQQLIDDLLEYSRVGRTNSKMEEVDFNEILQDVEKNLNSLIKENRASIRAQSELPVVKGFKYELVRVMQNLISNAIKFKKPGTDPVVEIGAEKKKKHWVFSVKDNGIGISEEHSERIFNIFERLHSKSEYTGTGIGLAVARKIIDRHGGRIWAKSGEGKGSIFYFTLPAN